MKRAWEHAKVEIVRMVLNLRDCARAGVGICYWSASSRSCVNLFSLYCSSRALCISNKRGRRRPEWFRSKRLPDSSPWRTLTASTEEPSLSYYCYCLLSRWLKARILPMKTWSTPGACQASLWLLGTEYWKCKVSLLDYSSVFFRMVYVCISTADSGLIADAANQSCYCVATFEIVVVI